MTGGLPHKGGAVLDPASPPEQHDAPAIIPRKSRQGVQCYPGCVEIEYKLAVRLRVFGLGQGWPSITYLFFDET